MEVGIYAGDISAWVHGNDGWQIAVGSELFWCRVILSYNACMILFMVLNGTMVCHIA